MKIIYEYTPPELAISPRECTHNPFSLTTHLSSTMLINCLFLSLFFGFSLATEDTMEVISAIQRGTEHLRAIVDAMPTDEELDFQCINRNYFAKFVKNSTEKVESLETKIGNSTEKLEAQMKEVKDKLEAKVDNVTKLEAKVDNVTDKMEAQMKEVKSEVQTISSKLSAILSRMDQMNKNAETIEAVVQCCPPIIKIPLRLWNLAGTGPFQEKWENVEIKVPVGASVGDVRKAVSALLDRSPERTKMVIDVSESKDGEKLFQVYGGGKWFFTTEEGERKKAKNVRYEELKDDNDEFIFPLGRRMILIIYARLRLSHAVTN